MKLYTATTKFISNKKHAFSILLGSILVMLACASFAKAVLVQPYNYMLDDSSILNDASSSQPHLADSGSLSPFYNDQSGSSEQSADKDIVSIIGERLARMRFARMLDSQQRDENAAEVNHHQGHFSQEMAEMIQREQQESAAAGNKQDGSNQDPSLSSSVANMLLNVAAQAAASATSNLDESSQDQTDALPTTPNAAMSDSSNNNNNAQSPMSSRGSIMELDTTSSSSGSSSAMPSKSDLKNGPLWFNPKESIPVLKISSMATPSKYKKVYFRSEKKLVDGAFHSVPANEQNEKKSLMKTFNSGVQRRSSRGTSSSVPPSILQDGVIDFLKKFRDVYIQTRPVNTASAASSSAAASASPSSPASTFASFLSAAASSPFVSVLAPPSSSSSKPNLANALSAVAQATGNGSGSSSPSSSSSSGSGALAAAATVANAANPNKSPLTAQSYVSFWSKTFPNWVRKMLKQLRRQALYNSNKRQQAHAHNSHHHHHHHHGSSVLGHAAQAAASGAVASVVEHATSGGSSSGSSSSGSSGSSSSSSSH